MSFLSFRNYESLKLEPNNYTTVGWRFALAGIFYLFLFIYLLKRISNGDKEIKEKKDNEINDVQGLNDEADNDKTEYFLEGRL